MNKLWTRSALVELLALGGAEARAIELLFFWGHTPKAPPAVDNACLSQWFPAAFVLDGVRYATAEHFMMAEKARLFRDDAALRIVLESATPADAKKAGRAVKDFDDQAWARARSASVVTGNIAKFDQNPALAAHLKSTGAKILVEASPRDRIWGIGMGASNPDARDPAKWRGQNLLGFALVEARRQLFGD